MGISPAPGAKCRPEYPNVGDGPQGNKQPDGNCSTKVGELPERVRGMNKRKANTSANIFSTPLPYGHLPYFRGEVPSGMFISELHEIEQVG